MTRYIRLRFKR